MSGCSGGSCSSCSSDPDRLPPGLLKAYNLNQSVADGVLVWIEAERTGDAVRISDVSAELISAAKGITEGRVFGAVFGGNDLNELYSEIFGYGVETLYHVRDQSPYAPESYASSMAQLAERISPALILIGATSRGRELAPRLASMLGSGLTADCTGLRAEGRDVIMTRPAFGGTLMADIQCIGYPQMATVRPGTFRRPEKSEGQGTVVYWQSDACCAKEIISEARSAESGSDIRDAKILISLGEGVKERALVDVAESVAAKLGGMVSCSRAFVEKGWMPRSRQVGMSGRTVAPDVYIAFGISGAVQHIAGMSKAKKVIVVNSDPDAPIHRCADLSLITDAGAVLREMDRSL